MDLEIMARVREILETSYTFGPVEDEASLIEAGFVDSVNIVSLTLELESKLGIQVPASEMTPENWTSVRSITSMCMRIQLGAPNPETRRPLSEIIFGSRSMVDQMKAEIARARRHAHAVSFVVLKLGEAVREPDTAVLSETWLEVGKLIAGNLRLEDSVSLLRLHDDGGALLGLLPHATDRSVITAVRRIGSLLLDGFGNRYDVRAFRYGVATFPVDGAELEDLIQKATSAWHELDAAALASDDTVTSSKPGAAAE